MDEGDHFAHGGPQVPTGKKVLAYPDLTRRPFSGPGLQTNPGSTCHDRDEGKRKEWGEPIRLFVEVQGEGLGKL